MSAGGKHFPFALVGFAMYIRGSSVCIFMNITENYFTLFQKYIASLIVNKKSCSVLLDGGR